MAKTDCCDGDGERFLGAKRFSRRRTSFFFVDYFLDVLLGECGSKKGGKPDPKLTSAGWGGAVQRSQFSTRAGMPVFAFFGDACLAPL
jgi:hypothetical protein